MTVDVVLRPVALEILIVVHRIAHNAIRTPRTIQTFDILHFIFQHVEWTA